MRITSRNNAVISSSSALLDKKYRDREGRFLLHGKKLADEALSSGIRIVRVFAVPELEQYAEGLASASGAALYITEPHVFEKLTDQRAPEGVCVEAEIPERKFDPRPGSFILVCDRLSDPGNLGSVLRSARAFGAGGVVLSAGCADLYSPKVQRGAMGAGLCGGIVTGTDTASVIRELREKGFRTYAAALHTDAVRLSDADLSGSCAVVIGNEGGGLDPETVGLADRALFIEMEPSCESLNAAVAASVIMYRRYTGG